MALYQHLTETTATVPCRVLGVDIDPVLIERANSKYETQSSNVTFATCDLMQQCIGEGTAPTDTDNPITRFLTQGGSERNTQDKFDLVCCFSVTLWIHLNNGDEGLKAFLKYVSKKARFLLLEPQPWKCYKTAVRRMKKLDCDPFEHFKELQWRETVDTDICTFLEKECGMRLQEKFGQTDWERVVCLFESET